MFYHQKFSTH